MKTRYACQHVALALLVYVFLGCTPEQASVETKSIEAAALESTTAKASGATHDTKGVGELGGDTVTALEHALVGSPANHRGLPAGHPPIPSGPKSAPHGMGGSPPPLEGGDPAMPLLATGAGSAAELKNRLSIVKTRGATPDQLKRLEEAFRKTFTMNRHARDYPGAKTLLDGLGDNALTADLAHRVLGYVAVNTGFDAKGAIRHYSRAVALDSEYGEAHYALSFMYLMGDIGTGRTHFNKAMALGVEDARGLAKSYTQASSPTP